MVPFNVKEMKGMREPIADTLPQLPPGFAEIVANDSDTLPNDCAPCRELNPNRRTNRGDSFFYRIAVCFLVASRTYWEEIPMTAEVNFVRQQGFRDATSEACVYQYPALMWQTRAIGDPGGGWTSGLPDPAWQQEALLTV